VVSAITETDAVRNKHGTRASLLFDQTEMPPQHQLTNFESDFVYCDKYKNKIHNIHILFLLLLQRSNRRKEDTPTIHTTTVVVGMMNRIDSIIVQSCLN
jgi:hypothetical protein